MESDTLAQRIDALKTEIAALDMRRAALQTSMTELERRRAAATASSETKGHLAWVRSIVLRLREAHAFLKRGQPVPPVGVQELAAVRQGLFRRGIPWVELFDDSVAQRIVEARPLSEIALARVTGVGPKKARRFGEYVVALFVWDLDPEAVLPERPSYERCSRCDNLHVLARIPIGSAFVCGRCLKSTDPRVHRTGITLESGKDWGMY